MAGKGTATAPEGELDSQPQPFVYMSVIRTHYLCYCLANNLEPDDDKVSDECARVRLRAGLCEVVAGAGDM